MTARPLLPTILQFHAQPIGEAVHVVREWRSPSARPHGAGPHRFIRIDKHVHPTASAARLGDSRFGGHHTLCMTAPRLLHLRWKSLPRRRGSGSLVGMFS